MYLKWKLNYLQLKKMLNVLKLTCIMNIRIEYRRINFSRRNKLKQY